MIRAIRGSAGSLGGFLILLYSPSLSLSLFILIVLQIEIQIFPRLA